jgi:O-antigen/teichoic acid export membrane protein
MIGHEWDSVFGIGIVAIANVVLNMLLISLYCIDRAAVANFTSLLLWNIWLAVLVQHRTGLVSHALGNRIFDTGSDHD